MVKYNFREICSVPTSESFVDVMLARTNRRTPTVVRSKWKISSIRQFYMRKVRFTQQNMTERLTKILDEFPRLDSLHPFYADLINVLYDRDHYKLALGQMNIARQIIQNLGKDYVKLLKYGDSAYRCKALKRAALGRMAKIVRSQKAAFAYLEQVRQHLSRLPSIDPHSRTLLLTGFPNAGKSSFMNQITKADVEVQSYPFTTKSLYVGHCDYEYLRWQVIDSPGILDRPLEERNTIEMQAITALAHLNACVLFFVDLSPHCSYSIESQVSLFFSLLPLFNNKPVVFVLNKTDLRGLDELDSEERAAIDRVSKLGNVKLLAMSNVEKKNVMTVRNTACTMLLSHRIEVKAKSGKLKDIEDRLFVAKPTRRDDVVRDCVIPDSVRREWLLRKKGVAVDRTGRTKLLAEIEKEKGGPGVYWFDTREHWKLRKDEWKYDPIPEIYDGKNVADFYYPEVGRDLESLEQEEAQILREEKLRDLEQKAESGVAVDSISPEDQLLYRYIKRKIALAKQKSTGDRSTRSNRPTIGRPDRKLSLASATEQLDDLGIDTTRFSRRHKFEAAKERKKSDALAAASEFGVDVQTVARAASKERRPGDPTPRGRSRSRARSHTPSRGISTVRASWTAAQLKRKAIDQIQKQGRQHSSDRAVTDKKPKHLFMPRKSAYKGDWR